MIALLALACTDEVVDTGQANAGPVLTHTAPTGPFLEGDDILIEVDAQDADDGVGVDWTLPTPAACQLGPALSRLSGGTRS